MSAHRPPPWVRPVWVPPKTAEPVTATCATCGAQSRPFLSIINPDLWRCDTCLPDITHTASTVVTGSALPYTSPRTSSRQHCHGGRVS